MRLIDADTICFDEINDGDNTALNIERKRNERNTLCIMRFLRKQNISW